MKKLLAVFLSALMLCAMIPFSAVAYAEEYDGPTMAAVPVNEDGDEIDTANAGDEILIQVRLLNNPGVIAVAAEVVYDHDVMELVTYYNEDEEVDMNMIEIGATFNASSNKYITFGPLGKCSVFYSRGTAKSDCTKELFFTATFKVKDDAVSGTYPLSITFKPKSACNLAKEIVVFDVATTYITINGSEPAGCAHTYDNDCDADCNLCGEIREVAGHNYVDGVCSVCGAADPNYVPPCEHEYTYACDKFCNKCYEETNPNATHTIVAVEAVEPTCQSQGNIAYWTCSDCGSCWADEALTQLTNSKNVLIGAAEHNLVHIEAVQPGCHYDGNIEYWYCTECEIFWQDEALTQITNSKNVILPALGGDVVAFEAIEPGCHYDGQIAYWFCPECEQFWQDEALTQLTNSKNVVLPAIGSENLQHVEAVAPTCDNVGNIEYWYCPDCEQYWQDEALTQLTNAKNVVLPVSHNVIHVAAKAPTCDQMGNIEYWYCADCGQAWLDELCHLNTNLKAVVLATTDHSYTNAHDVDCDVCGAVRDVVLSAEEIVLFGGNSVTESRDGLGFKFDVAVDGIAFSDEYVADYSNATVTIEGVEYKLVKMGVVANNQGYANQTLENVDDTYVLNVEAVKAFEDVDGTHFAVRFINIPEEHLDTVITARSYFIYENAGEQIVVYGEDIATTYNAELG